MSVPAHRACILWLSVCAFLVNDAPAQIASLAATLSLQSLDSVTVPYQNGMPVPSFEKQQRAMISLAGTWKKQRFSADHSLTMKKRDAATYALLLAEASSRHLPAYDDAGWEAKAIPGVENTMNGYEQTPEFFENGVWYRCRFPVPDSLRGKRALLKFLAVNYVADVWLNGTYLGWHEGGYTPFAFGVDTVLEYGGENVLAVRVDNPPWNPWQTADVPNNRRIDIVPYYKVDWFNYAGIMHDVYLEFSNPVAVARADVVPLNVNGDLKTTIGLVNNLSKAETVTVNIGVYEAAITPANIQTEYPAILCGAQVGVTGPTSSTLVVSADSCRVLQVALNIPEPKLWSPHHPNLYILKATVVKNGIPVDEFATQFGVRTLRATNGKFLLNGKEMFLPGAARHEDHPVYGRSVPNDIIYNDFALIKSLNILFVRTAHYPNNPYTYLIADRLGLGIMEEIPVWWFDTDDAWLIQNVLRQIHTQMFREMVFRDYNRPSVFLWSTCNECMIQAGRQTFISNVRNELTTLYPDGRFVSQSAAADRPGAMDISQSVCDVPGWTMYFGIFHGGTYYGGTKQFLQDAHAMNPTKPILDTEFGNWSTTTGAEEHTQIVVFDSTFRAFSEVAIRDDKGAVNPSGFLMAATWWCVFDWYTAQQNPGYESMGLYHMDRTTAKPIAAHLQAAYKPYFDNAEPASVTNDQNARPPVSYSLSQNFPNPFNPRTTIRFSLPIAGRVKVTVCDLLGREMATLVDDVRQAGTYATDWNASQVASGVYFYTLTADGHRESRKMAVLK